MHAKYLSYFRANVRLVMKRDGISQRNLAKIVGLSYPHVNRILQGKVNPSINVCELISKSLDIGLVELLQNPKDFRKITIRT